ncbi:MAG: hypothetical protein Phog2KO_27870 [Phototrophicaceae bacterium]
MDYKKKKITGQQGELMRALEISVDDLIANHEGYITEAQRVSLPKRQGYLWRPYRVTCGGCAFLGLIFPIMFLGSIMPFVIIIFSLFSFAIAAFFGYSGLHQYSLMLIELTSNNFKTIQGIVVVYIGANGGYLEINGLKFNASHDVLHRIRHLEPYIIHYLSKTKIILSMEHIVDDDNIRQDERSSRLQDSDSASDTLGGNYDNSAENRQQSG